MKKSLLSSVLVFGALLGCGSPNSSEPQSNRVEGQLGSQKYFVVSGSPENLDKKVKGSGSLIFSDMLAGSDASHNFKVSFKLEQQGSQFHLVSFSDQNLNHGLNLSFVNTAAGLQMKLLGAGGTVYETVLVKGNASKEWTFFVDVHNGEGEDAHVIVSVENKEYEGKHTKLFNSAKHAKKFGKGNGAHWGLSFANASVSSAEVGEALHKHH